MLVTSWRLVARLIVLLDTFPLGVASNGSKGYLDTLLYV